MSIEPSTSSDYRQEILLRLDTRNDKLRVLERIFTNYALVADDLSKSRMHGARTRTTSVGGSNAELQALREEMSLLYKQKNKNDQDLIESNRILAESKATLSRVIDERDKLQTDHQKLCAHIAELEHMLVKTREEKATLHDEWIALQAVSRSQTEQIQKLESEQLRLINKIKELNEQRASKMNMEIENQAALQQRRIQEDIARAIAEPSRDSRSRTNSLAEVPAEFSIGDIVPTRVFSKFEANNGEMLDVLWLAKELFATAGSGRLVKLHRVEPNGKSSLLCNLTGANQATTRLDYLAETKCLLAACNDHTVRLWNIESQQPKCTFSGHTDKVTTARFHQGNQVISGSSDRTIRLWDVLRQKVISSYFPGSAVHDVIGDLSYGASSFISGHFDKKIRIWDSRSSEPINMIEMNGKITSLFLGLDGTQFLCSTRDDTLSLIDIRTRRAVHIYSAEQYHTAADFARCTISPSMEYCAAGSSNGMVFIWNLHSTKLEKCLMREHDNPVMSVSWNPCGSGLLSCDRQKYVVHWS